MIKPPATIQDMWNNAPESQKHRTAPAFRAIAARDYDNAAWYLRNAAEEFGTGTIWGKQALEAAKWAENMHDIYGE